MTINRNNLFALYNLLQTISDKKFNINTQYKFLKIKSLLDNEMKIYYHQISDLTKYLKKNDKGEIISDENNLVEILPEKKQECQDLIEQINNVEILLPDLYFSLDELAPLELTMKDLELLEQFIKE